MSAKMGRPRLPKGEKKGSTLSIRLTKEERKTINEAVKRAGAENASDWARGLLLAAARGAGSAP